MNKMMIKFLKMFVQNGHLSNNCNIVEVLKSQMVHCGHQKYLKWMKFAPSVLLFSSCDIYIMVFNIYIGSPSVLFFSFCDINIMVFNIYIGFP